VRMGDDIISFNIPICEANIHMSCACDNQVEYVILSQGH